MSKTYSVSFPDPEAIALESDARRLGVTVPDLIRTRARAGNSPERTLSRPEIEHILREITMISYWARGEIRKDKDYETYSEAIGKAARERLAILADESKRERKA